MNNIKKFDDFLNEELNPSTYASAAEKLRKKGHKGRADELDRFAKSKIEPAEITLGDKKFIILPENIQLYKDADDFISVWVMIERYLIEEGDPTDEDDYDEDGIAIDITKKENNWKTEVSGIILQDRKSAISIWKLVTQWSETQNDIIKDNIKKLSVNDFYE